LNVTLDRFARGQASRDKGLELDNIRIGEFESVKRSAKSFRRSVDGIDGSHDFLIGWATAGIDQKDFAVVDSVGGDQLAHKDRIRSVGLLDLEEETERIADLSRLNVSTLTGCDFHDNSRSWNNRRLFGNGGNSAGDRQVQSTGQSVILQLVRAAESQSDILTGHDLVVMLSNNLNS
jgi:hypothetical protein